MQADASLEREGWIWPNVATEAETGVMQWQAKEFSQPLEPGRGKELICPLEPPGRAQPCQYLNFSLMNTDLGLLPPTVRE